MRRFLPWLFVLVLIISPAVANAKDVTLSWDKSPTQTVTGYLILIANSEATLSQTGFIVDAGNALTRTILDLEDTSDQYFCVKAYDGQGNQSVCSNIVYSPAIVDELPVLDLHIDVKIIK